MFMLCTARVSRLFASVAVLSLASACTTMQTAYDSAYGMVAGDDKTAAPKAVVRTPAAAPVQTVSSSPVSTEEADDVVELGSLRDTAEDALEASTNEEPRVIAQESPAPTLAPAPAAVSHAALNNALLTIRFNQPHVYYDDALTSAVNQAEKARSGVVYEVLSNVPDLSVLSPDMQQKLSARAKDNLRNVVVRIQQLGVPADRVRIAEQTLRIRSQEIQVFVR